MNDINEVLDKSYDRFSKIKENKKTIKSIIYQQSKEAKVDKRLLTKLINILTHCNTDKDKVKKIFLSFSEIVYLICKFGKQDILNPYLDKLDEMGISVSLNIHHEYNLDSIIDIEELIDENERLQEHIKVSDSAEASDLGFGPESEYPKIAKMYCDKVDGKDIEDKFHDKMNDIEKMQNSYNFIFNKNK